MSRHQLLNTFMRLTYLVVSLGSFCIAATAPAPEAGRGFGFAYDSAKEITVIGTVNRQVARSAGGGPVGTHLLISAGGSLIDAHIGPYISNDNRQALKPGQLVQVVGVNESVHGKDLLLARQIIFNGRLVTVRNERGFLVRSSEPSRKARKQGR
ncbi:MAG TPA: hypothetical protein VL983_01270 [Terriglobales bacterium]|nr:hypothetical protein [Terriglobales bacterium]